MSLTVSRYPRDRLPGRPKLFDEETSGFVVNAIDEAVATVGRAAGLDRRQVRARFKERFTANRMAQEYLSIYSALPGVQPRRQELAACSTTRMA